MKCKLEHPLLETFWQYILKPEHTHTIPILFLKMYPPEIYMCVKMHVQIRSDQISHSVVSDSLQPHISQHANTIIYPFCY